MSRPAEPRLPDRLTLALLTSALDGFRPRCGDPVTHKFFSSRQQDGAPARGRWCSTCPLLVPCAAAGGAAIDNTEPTHPRAVTAWPHLLRKAMKMSTLYDEDGNEIPDPDWDDVPPEAVDADGEVLTVNGLRGLWITPPRAYADARRHREDREAGR